jgi:hypothetical protein
MRPLRYLPYGEAASLPNVVVDGAPNACTVLTLSHWPGTECPPELRADLSAEMAFRYLDEGGHRHGDAEVVTNNHFDEDGLVSVFALSEPEEAQRQRALLVDVARAGDFAWFRDRRAARMSMVITAHASRLDTASAYREMLPLLPRLAGELDAFGDLWADEDALLSASEAAIATGRVRVEERPELDLAIVTAPPGPQPHPMAVHNVTGCFRILRIQGRRYELAYRYETWVQYQSRRPPPRVDLTGLAQRLSHVDPSGIAWAAGDVDDITPRLAPADDEAESGLSPEELVAEVVAWLSGPNPT